MLTGQQWDKPKNDGGSCEFTIHSVLSFFGVKSFRSLWFGAKSAGSSSSGLSRGSKAGSAEKESRIECEASAIINSTSEPSESWLDPRDKPEDDVLSFMPGSKSNNTLNQNIIGRIEVIEHFTTK